MHRSMTCAIASLLLVGVGAAHSQPMPQMSSTSAPAPVGWLCDTGSRHWLQFSPCPTSYMRAAPVTLNGMNANTGALIHGTGTVDLPGSVRSTPLDDAGVCALLGDPSIRIPHHGSSDVYERNNLKAKYCGG